MKRLMLMRHGEAQDLEQGQPDMWRRLSRKGVSDMQHLHRQLLAEGLLPQFALASSANRTEMTLLEVMGGLDYDGDMDFSEALYNAEAQGIIAAAQALDDKFESALIVAHNPGIYQAIVELVGEAHHPELLKKIGGNYKSGTLTILDCPVENWAALAPQKNKLTKIFIPG